MINQNKPQIFYKYNPYHKIAIISQKIMNSITPIFPIPLSSSSLSLIRLEEIKIKRFEIIHEENSKLLMKNPNTFILNQTISIQYTIGKSLIGTRISE